MPSVREIHGHQESEVLTVLQRQHVWSLVSFHINPYPETDVGHPGPGLAKPSVKGLVFSYDHGAAKYAGLTKIQQPRVEIVESGHNRVLVRLRPRMNEIEDELLKI